MEENPATYRNFSINPILHLGGGGGGGGEGEEERGRKVPALISKILVFVTNTATATKFGDFSQNLSGKTMVR